MIIEKLGRDVREEDYADQELLDMLVDMLVGNFELGHQVTQLYSKERLLPERVITATFDNLQQRSLDGRISLFHQPARFFVFDMDEEHVRGRSKKDFHRSYFRRFAEFVQMVPEYVANEHVRGMLDILSGDDFARVYGRKGEIKVGDKGPYHTDPLLDAELNFAANLKNFLKKFYESSDTTSHADTSPEKMPRLIPVFNFQWPEVLTGEDAERAVEALRSYAGKRTLSRYDPAKGSMVIDEKGELTSYEKEIAEKSGMVIRKVYLQITSTNRIPQIIAAPLYALRAIPNDEQGETWLDMMLSNETILEEFESVGLQRI